MDRFNGEEKNQINELIISVIQQAVIKCLTIKSDTGSEVLTNEALVKSYPQCATKYTSLGSSTSSLIPSNDQATRFDLKIAEKSNDEDSYDTAGTETQIFEKEETKEAFDKIDAYGTYLLSTTCDVIHHDRKIYNKHPLQHKVNESLFEKGYTTGLSSMSKVDFKLVAEKEVSENSTSATFGIEWCINFNSKKRVHYVGQEIFFFSASHLGAFYSAKTNTMKFLLGLKGEVSSSSLLGNYLAIADIGPDECGIIVWDVNSWKPVRCWFGLLSGGTRLIEISPCRKYVTAISAAPVPIILHSNLETSYTTTCTLPAGRPLHVIHNMQNTNQCVITYSRKIVINNFNEGMFSQLMCDPPKGSSKIGVYKSSVFIGKENQILTCTNTGFVIVSTTEGYFVKMLQLQKCSINCLQFVKGFVIVACQDGTVWVYEQDLRLKTWVSLGSDSIQSLSILEGENTPVTQLIYSTENSIGLVSQEKCCHILAGSPNDVLSVDCYPNNHTVALGDAKGMVVLHNLDTKKIEMRRSITSCGVTVLVFLPNGSKLAAGTEEGGLFILDPVILTTYQVLPSARATIQSIIFTSNNKIMAYVHGGCGIGIFKQARDWNLKGKLQAHYKRVIGMVFIKETLLTVSEDRMLAQYDVSHELRLVSNLQIEGTAIPTSCAYYEGHLLIANNEHKVRFFDVEKQEIVRTIRSPGVIYIMKVANERLYFATDKSVGITALPYQGWTNGVVAHPRKVIDICVCNSKRFITIGEDDTTALLWTVNLTMARIETPRFSNFIHQRIKQIFKHGSIDKNQVTQYLQFFGYFPSRIDTKNLMREITTARVSEGEFRSILWNHGQFEISLKELRDALLTVCDMLPAPGPVVHIEQLLVALNRKVDTIGMSSKEALGCLRVLCAPGLIPPQISIDRFISEILGVDLRLPDIAM